ncbi:MAG: hypothetical protein MZU97_00380 [Bacillus subtilis]|nr:hypothetical protein [Bacillus subtilis]
MAALRNAIKLQPGESKTLVYTLGCDDARQKRDPAESIRST